jgi:hypothetical protein
VLKARVRELWSEYRPQDPSSRTSYRPGELAQCDLWSPPKRISLEAGASTSPVW